MEYFTTFSRALLSLCLILGITTKGYCISASELPLDDLNPLCYIEKHKCKEVTYTVTNPNVPQTYETGLKCDGVVIYRPVREVVGQELGGINFCKEPYTLINPPPVIVKIQKPGEKDSKATFEVRGLCCNLNLVEDELNSSQSTSAVEYN